MNIARIPLALGGVFGAAIVLSTLHPFGNPRLRGDSDAPLLGGSTVPDHVRAILEAKCADCHSERTHYPLYAHVAPVSWMIDRDVSEGRNHLNLSQWQRINDESRINALTRLASVVHAGQMPPQKYVMLHPGGRLSPIEQEDIYEWAKSERKRIRQQRTDFSGQSLAVHPE